MVATKALIFSAVVALAASVAAAPNVERRATECYEDCVTRCNTKTDATEKATCLTGCASKAACTTTAAAAAATTTTTKSSTTTTKASTTTTKASSSTTTTKASSSTSSSKTTTTTTKTTKTSSSSTTAAASSTITFPPANAGCAGADYNGALGSPWCYAKTAPNCADKGVTAPSGLPSAFPTPSARLSCDAPFLVANGTTWDGSAKYGGLVRFDRGPGMRAYYGDNCLTVEPGEESVVFVLGNGATLKNVIIGKEVGDSIYCYGDCTLENVYWESICEDGWSIKYAGSNAKAVLNGGMMYGHTDKAIQHNSGGSVTVNNLDIWYTTGGKMYRSCGDCPAPDSYSGRKFVGSSIRVHGTKSGEFVRHNGDKGDTAKLSNIHIPSNFGVDDWVVCDTSGSGKYSSVGDGTMCIYAAGDVLWDSTN